MGSLILDDKTHKYTIDGADIPGISEAIKSAGLVDDRWFSEYSRDRGHAAHSACHFYDENDLIEETLDPNIVPYLEAWKKFRIESGFVPQIIEQKLHSQIYGFAGTPDRAGILNGDEIVLEIKTGLISAVTGIQLAAQDVLLNEIGFKAKKRFAIQLSNQGAYKLTRYQNVDDLHIFLSCLKIHNFKVKNRIGGA